MLEVRPMHDNARSCVEDIIVSVASWWGLDYLYMYAQSWGFAFRHDAVKTSSILGNLIDGMKSNGLALLDRYHGIQLHGHYNKTLAEALAIIKEQLDSGYPVGIGMNGFCCQNESCPHYGIRNNGNLSYRGWSGRGKHIRMIHCNICDTVFSERKGTVLEEARLPYSPSLFVKRRG